MPRERPGLSRVLCQVLDHAHMRKRPQSAYRPPVLKPEVNASDLYEAFERRSDGATDRAWTPLDFESTGTPTRRCLEVVCQYDTKQQGGDQRGATGPPVYPRPRAQRGPLWTIFETYAARDVAAETMTAIARKEESERRLMVSRMELLALVEDFGLCPKLVRRAEAMLIFKVTDAPAGRGEVRRDMEQNVGNQLCYEEFVEALVRVALLAFGREEGGSRYPTGLSRVRALMEWFDMTSTDTRKLRAKLAALDRNARARKESAAQRRWEYVGGVQPATRAELEALKQPVPDELYDYIRRHDVALEERNAGPRTSLSAAAGDAAGVPAWASFARTHVDCGVGTPGTSRHYRVSVRNRDLSRKAVIHIACHGLPFVEATFSERSLPPGIPRVIELTAKYTEVGEWLGSVIVTVEPDLDAGDDGAAPAERYVIPVYGQCVPAH